jgi:signal peptidase
VSAVIDTDDLESDDELDAGTPDAGPIATPANRRVRRSITERVLYLIGLAIFLAAAWFLWPVRWGGTFAEVVVSGHSMEPVFHTGDLVVTKKSDHYRVGDKVVYTIPKGEPGAGIHVVHRIIGIRRDGTYVMQGDNRVTPDDWRPTSHDAVGRVVAVLPVAGRLLLWLARPWVLAGLFGLIITVWLWPDQDVRRPVSPEMEDVDGPTPTVSIEHVPPPVPRTEPWWADEEADLEAIDAERSDHVMPSAPSSSEWDEITTSASSSSESSS